MDIMQLCIFAGIAAGGIFVSILQVYLMKSVKGYRFVFVPRLFFAVMPVITTLIMILKKRRDIKLCDAEF